MSGRKPTRRTWIYAAAVGLLVFLYAVDLLWPVERAVTRVLGPALNRLQSLGTGIGDVYRRQTARSDQQLELTALQDEVARLTAANAELQRASEENAVLRRQLELGAAITAPRVLANVIGRSDPLAASGPTDTVIIDRGRHDGIAAGAPVLADTGVLVGTVAEVRDATALVRLTNHRDCKVAATVLGAEGVNGVTEGERGLTVAMRFIPQTAAIAVGDLVVTAGIEERMPRGVAIGRVTAVQREPNDIWQSATIQPLTDPDRLLIVSVLY